MYHRTFTAKFLLVGFFSIAKFEYTRDHINHFERQQNQILGHVCLRTAEQLTQQQNFLYALLCKDHLNNIKCYCHQVETTFILKVTFNWGNDIYKLENAKSQKSNDAPLKSGSNEINKYKQIVRLELTNFLSYRLRVMSSSWVNLTNLTDLNERQPSQTIKQ